MTSTRTFTSTFVRIELIELQFEVVLRSFTDLSVNTIAKIKEGIENQWITEMTIYAQNALNMCEASLTLEVDWKEHNAQLAQGRTRVSVDDRWLNGAAIPVDASIKFFEDFIQEKEFRPCSGWCIGRI